MSATRSGLRFPVQPLPDRGNPHAAAVFNALLATVPALFVAVMTWSVLHGQFSALDFRDAYWVAGHRVLSGESPYSWTPAQFREGVAFVYPALSALVFAPVALLTRAAGSVVFTLLGECVAPAALALLGVRDWRVYAVTLVWLPVCAGWLTANESLFMALGLAAVWRWRDRAVVAGFLTAALISLKPFLWPLVLWLIATRRWRASASTVVWGILLNAVAWSVVGFGEIGAYLHAISADTASGWRLGFGIPALLAHVGLGRPVGMAALVVLSAVLALGLFRSGFARRDEVVALTFAAALAIVSSPLVWSHYLALLLVPLALVRPRLHWLWGLPILLWVAPPDAHLQLWQELIFWGVAGVMFVALVRVSAGRSDLLPEPPWRPLRRVQV